MSFEKLLDHKCDIYHAVEEGESPGYGLLGQMSVHYPEQPDHVNISCHFGLEGRQSFVIQAEPQTNIDDRMQLLLPKGTDVRFNDKIVRKENGLVYTANVPENARGHHVYVYLRREKPNQAVG